MQGLLTCSEWLHSLWKNYYISDYSRESHHFTAACGNNLIFGGEKLGSLIGKTFGIKKKTNFHLLLNINILNSCDSLYLFAF